MSSSTEERLAIEGPAGSLELLVTRVDNPVAVVVICHPNPVQGGTMHNKVVHTLMRAARDRQASVVRFNFRGVGKSEGEHADGRGEVDDCLAVIAWALAEFELPLWLMGFPLAGMLLPPQRRNWTRRRSICYWLRPQWRSCPLPSCCHWPARLRC